MISTNMSKKFVFIFLSGILISCGKPNSAYVDPFIGTSGDHGQVAPGACVPYGMISVCPDSHPWQQAGYDYAVPEICGISITRLSGVGCRGVGGNMRIMPFDGDVDTPVSIVKESEKAGPGWYSSSLSNGVKCDFTATENMAVERYDLSKSTVRTFRLDLRSSFDGRKTACSYNVEGPSVISGHIISPNACANGRYQFWFKLVSNKDFTIANAGKNSLDMIFADNVKNIELRIAISSVDSVAASKVYDKWEKSSFSALRRRAAQMWTDKLAKVDVKGGTEDDKVLFYTSLYRLYHSPMVINSPDGRYRGTDNEIYDAGNSIHYGSWSMWDTFRTKFPLITILEPEEMSDISRSLVDLYRTGKKNRAMPMEPAPTVRTEHTIITLLDAWVKGIRGFDLKSCIPGMWKEILADLKSDSPDQNLESAYDLWALGWIGEILSMEDVSTRASELSDSLFNAVWREHFMTITPDFAVMGNNGLYQGSRWQYRWAVPPYIDRMALWVGRDTLAAQLSQFFDRRLYNQGNEPDIHTPFIFNLLGMPEKTQKVVREYLTDDKMPHLYGGNAEYPEPFIGRAFRNAPEGYAPEMDEDDGTMSGWYAFCAMGFYPVVVGSDVYEVFSPLFDEIKIHGGNKTFTIKTTGRKSAEDTITQMELDGKVLDEYHIRHSDITAGKTLTIKY